MADTADASAVNGLDGVNGLYRTVAQSVPVLAAAMAIVAAVSAIALGSGRGDSNAVHAFGVFDALGIVTLVLWTVVGAFLAWRLPYHPIGWLFLVMGLVWVIEPWAQEYVLARSSDGRPFPGWQYAAWLRYWIFAPGLSAFVMALLLFPSGTLPSRRWRWVLRAVVVVGAAVTLGWATAGWSHRLDPRLTELVDGSGWRGALPPLTTVLVLLLIVAAGSLLARYRRAQQEERAQLKWLALAVMGVGLATTAGIVSTLAGAEQMWFVELLGTVSIAAIPVAVAFAIQRYHLYDIDRIISKTVAYTVLSGLLAGVYAGVVLLIGALPGPLAVSSDAAVAVSTLAVAGAFGPLRRRVQTTVDRRFHRRPYDAARTVTAFQAAVRDEVRVEAVCQRLLSAAEEALQPAVAGIWLCDSVSKTRSRS